jgi:hypothetical protein
MQENKINIAALMMVSMPLLAHNLDREDCPETVYSLLERDPEKAGYPVRLIAKNYIYSKGAKVKITSVNYSHADPYPNISLAAAYFSIVFYGTQAEIDKIVGRDKLFESKKESEDY